MSRKIKQLIRLEDLASVYAGIVNNCFDVCVNAVTRVDPLKPCGLMLATRQPYKISNIKAESLQVALRFYVECENEDKYNDTIAVLSQLTGFNKGVFTSNERKFKYFSYLDFAKPLGEPEVNSGKFYQTLEFMGTCLVTQNDGGVLISNEVETDICFKPDSDNELSGRLEVLSATTALVKAQESPQMANSVVGKTINTTQVFSYSYTFIVLKNAISERILKALTNVEPLGVNEKIKITDKYPAFTGEPFSVERYVVLTGGQINLNAGAFATGQISLQDRLDIGNISVDNSGNTGGDVEVEGDSTGGGNSGSLNGPPSGGSSTTTPTYDALVTIDRTNISIAGIVGNFRLNDDNTISCDIGSVISIVVSGASNALRVEGATSVFTGDTFVASPKPYDITITNSVATISTYRVDSSTEII